MRLKLKDISRYSVKAVDSTDFPRLDDEVFDIMINDKKVLRGVSGRDMGLSDLFASYFMLEEGDAPTAVEMAEFRVGKVIEMLQEAKRIAKELEVRVDFELVFDDKRIHPHLMHKAEGDVIVGKYTVATGPIKYGCAPIPGSPDFPQFNKYTGDESGGNGELYELKEEDVEGGKEETIDEFITKALLMNKPCSRGESDGDI